MTELKGKNALITGASRGIGRQIALGLAERGCNIIVHGRAKESCTETLRQLEKHPVKTYCVYGDLSDKEQTDQMIAQVQRLSVSIDILYNNAAIMTPYHDDFRSHSRKEWIETFKVNVIAIYELCSAFIPAMIQNGFGRVVNVTSGIKDKPELAPYGASKWAVRKLTEDLAVKLKNTGVRINALDPGWLQTDMGGKEADYPVTAVLPGGVAPVTIENDGPNGRLYSAIEQRWSDLF